MLETAGQKTATEVAALLRARNALLWIVTSEEGRVERSLIDAITKKAQYDVRMWDCDQGVTDMTGTEVPPGKSATDIAQVLATIRDSKERAVWILKDVPFWLTDPTVKRRLRNLARALPSSPRKEARAIIIMTPSAEVPPELSDHAIVIKWVLPDREEIKSIFESVLGDLPDEVRAQAVAPEDRDAAIEAAVGLSAEAAASCYSKSLVTQGKKIIPAIVAAEKKRVINKEKGIEWFDPDPRGLDAIGGLEPLKEWLLTRKLGFSQEARDFGLPLPKGMLLVGVPGGGKSLTAKATATAFGVPLLRADFGGAQSKWVGESQQNIRAVFAVAEAVGRCVLWIDEIEKALAGATSGAADGGVSSDALGTFLTWMQERKGQVFVIATSNDVSKLPPELLRKGRWDDLWFVDLPTSMERAAILRVILKKYGRENIAIDFDEVIAATSGFTGAEIDALLPDALFKAFADNKRLLTTEDVVKSALATVPLSRTTPEKIEELRKWAKGRARFASATENVTTDKGNRKLDM